MFSLTEQQYEELACAIRVGDVDIAGVVVLQHFIYELRGDQLVQRVQCESNYVARRLLTVLQREAGCTTC